MKEVDEKANTNRNPPQKFVHFFFLKSMYGNLLQEKSWKVSTEGLWEIT